jgi:hypothetical protein
VVDFAFDSGSVVESVMRCSEPFGNRRAIWNWVAFFEDGMNRRVKLLEIAPDGNIIFTRVELHHHGQTELFERLTTNPGLLGQFEKLVRDGRSATAPVHCEINGRSYRITSTGHFTVNQGEIDRPVLCDAVPQASDLIYFEMEAVDGAENPEERRVLGIATSHIALYFGRPLENEEVLSIFEREGQGTAAPKIEQHPDRPQGWYEDRWH